MITLKDIIKYATYWHIFLIAVVLSLSAAFLYLRVTPPKYKVSSTLLIQDDIKGDGILKGTAFSDLNMFQTSKTVDNEIEVLRSRDLLYKVLTGLSLETSYSTKTAFRTTQRYGKTLPIRVVVGNLDNFAFAKALRVEILDQNRFILRDGDKGIIYNFNQPIKHPHYTIKVIKGPAFAEKSSPITIRFKDLNLMAESYSLSKLSVVPIIKDANTIVISLLDEVPERGIDILNKLIETYNHENVDNKNAIARNTIAFIDNRLQYLTKDLSSVEQDVENYKQQNEVTNITADAQMNLNSSENYNQQLAASQVQLSIIASIESYLKKRDTDFGLVPSTLGLEDATLTVLTERYNNLQLERQRLLNTVRENNPLIVNMNEQLAGIKLSMKENLSNIKRRLRLEYNNLNSKSNEFHSKIKAVPVIERGLLERSREQGVKLSLYHYLLQKREETALSLTATIPTSHVIDKPAYKTTPEEPNDTLIYLCSFLVGIILPAGFIYGRDKLNPKVQDATDVQFITGARILGELSNKGKMGSVVIQKNSRTTISELFRYIRSNLNYLSNTDRNQVLMITSSIKGEGKTFFSINLGLTLSLTGKKVVLLEFDLRKPDLLSNIDVLPSAGISDFLCSDSISIDDIIHPSGLSSNMFVIGCGTNPDNPAELLMSSKLDVLFDKLKSRYDYVIVDTSPVGLVADAFSLDRYIDSSIYIVRNNFTNLFQLNILKDIYENKKLKNPLVVFNDAKENKNTYGYGSYMYS